MLQPDQSLDPHARLLCFGMTIEPVLPLVTRRKLRAAEQDQPGMRGARKVLGQSKADFAHTSRNQVNPLLT